MRNQAEITAYLKLPVSDMHDAEITAYLKYHASEECDQAFDYDGLCAVIAETDSDVFDPFVRVSCKIAERDFSLVELTRLSGKLARLAIAILSDNVLAYSDHNSGHDVNDDAIWDQVADAISAGPRSGHSISDGSE